MKRVYGLCEQVQVDGSSPKVSGILKDTLIHSAFKSLFGDTIKDDW